MADRYLVMWTSLPDIEQIFGLEPAPTERPADPRRNILLMGKIKTETPALGLWVQVTAVLTMDRKTILSAQTGDVGQLIRWEFIKSALTIEGEQPMVDTAFGLRPR
jgi:hypothetical protein